MENNPNPKTNGITDSEKVINQSDKIVNKKTENVHEATNKEHWVHDVNEEFGDDLVLPDEDAEKLN